MRNDRLKPFLFKETGLRPPVTLRQQEAGYQLNQIQLGFEPSDWKPMNNIGPSVREIRIHSNGEFRVIYITKLHETVYVLHAFQKKARKTPKKDLDLARTRLKLLQEVQS